MPVSLPRRRLAGSLQRRADRGGRVKRARRRVVGSSCGWARLTRLAAACLWGSDDRLAPVCPPLAGRLPDRCRPDETASRPSAGRERLSRPGELPATLRSASADAPSVPTSPRSQLIDATRPARVHAVVDARRPRGPGPRDGSHRRAEPTAAPACAVTRDVEQTSRSSVDADARAGGDARQVDRRAVDGRDAERAASQLRPIARQLHAVRRRVHPRRRATTLVRGVTAATDRRDHRVRARLRPGRRSSAHACRTFSARQAQGLVGRVVVVLGGDDLVAGRRSARGRSARAPSSWSRRTRARPGVDAEVRRRAFDATAFSASSCVLVQVARSRRSRSRGGGGRSPRARRAGGRRTGRRRSGGRAGPARTAPARPPSPSTARGAAARPLACRRRSPRARARPRRRATPCA